MTENTAIGKELKSGMCDVTRQKAEFLISPRNKKDNKNWILFFI